VVSRTRSWYTSFDPTCYLPAVCFHPAMKSIAILLGVSSLHLAPAASRSTAEPPTGSVQFEMHVCPIFKAHCFECHGEGKKLRGGLDLRLKHTMTSGGDTGPAMVPGKP